MHIVLWGSYQPNCRKLCLFDCGRFNAHRALGFLPTDSGGGKAKCYKKCFNAHRALGFLPTCWCQ